MSLYMCVCVLLLLLSSYDSPLCVEIKERITDLRLRLENRYN